MLFILRVSWQIWVCLFIHYVVSGEGMKHLGCKGPCEMWQTNNDFCSSCFFITIFFRVLIKIVCDRQTNICDRQTNICDGQTNICDGQTFMTDKHLWRTNICEGQTFVMDKHLWRTNKHFSFGKKFSSRSFSSNLPQNSLKTSAWTQAFNTYPCHKNQAKTVELDRVRTDKQTDNLMRILI